MFHVSVLIINNKKTFCDAYINIMNEIIHILNRKQTPCRQKSKTKYIWLFKQYTNNNYRKKFTIFMWLIVRFTNNEGGKNYRLDQKLKNKHRHFIFLCVCLFCFENHFGIITLFSIINVGGHIYKITGTIEVLNGAIGIQCLISKRRKHYLTLNTYACYVATFLLLHLVLWWFKKKQKKIWKVRVEFALHSDCLLFQN